MADTGVDKVIAIVPLYKSPELLDTLIPSIVAVADEANLLGIKFLFINDSPDHIPLSEKLKETEIGLIGKIRFEFICNQNNLGFVKSVNRGIDIALQTRSDALLLNSDIILTKGALTEIVRVAKVDPMISVVSPRSNNATICNSPYQDTYRLLNFEEACAAHDSIKEYLPQVTYVPTSVGFCLYININMVIEFGKLDEIYEGGYNEENDFIMRCNRFGYRAVLANHAFVYHLGSISFSKSEITKEIRDTKNRAILIERYPEYMPSVQRYFSSLEFETQSLISGLVKTSTVKQKFLFECNNIGPYYNGTFELAINVIRSYVRTFGDKYDFYVACSHQALVFHEMDKIIGLSFCWNDEKNMAPFAIAVRLAQPFSNENLINISKLAPITSFLILDTIAIDCLALNNNELDNIFYRMLQITSVVGYISDFSRMQTHRRFNLQKDCIEFFSLCSVDPKDYNPSGRIVPSDHRSGHVLLVGNHFIHKYVKETLELFKQVASRPEITVLGLKLSNDSQIRSFASGDLEQSLVNGLYDSADIVLFPSHYEGFGFPIMHALARKKPIIVRSLPVYDEIKSACIHGKNIHTRGTTQEMIDLACEGVEWIEEGETESHDWKDFAVKMDDAISRAICSVNHNQLYSRLSQIRHYAAEDRCKDLISVVAEQADIISNINIAHKERFEYRDIIHTSTQKSRFNLFRKSRVFSEILNENGHYLEIRKAFPIFETRELARRLLDCSTRIDIGQILVFSVKNKDSENINISEEYIINIVRAICVNSGLNMDKISLTKGIISFVASKRTIWHKDYIHIYNGEEFIQKIYALAFGREPDENAEVWKGRLASGASKLFIAQRLFSSDERIRIITQDISIMNSASIA